MGESSSPLSVIEKKDKISVEKPTEILSHAEEVAQIMRIYPIHSLFGLTYNDCMQLPFAEWQTLVEQARLTASQPSESHAEFEALRTTIVNCTLALKGLEIPDSGKQK